MYSSSAEKLFYEMGDIQAKKTISRSAAHKIGGSHSRRRAALPSDHLTKKEWMAMNGPIVTYDFRKTNLETFKQYPPDIRYQFLKLMSEKFGATQSALAQEMGCSQRNLGYHIARVGASDLFPLRRMTREQRNALHEFFSSSDDVAASAVNASTVDASNTLHKNNVPPEPPVAEPEPNLSVPASRGHMSMEELRLQFTGGFCPQQISNTLIQLLDEGTPCRITITCESM